MCSIMNTSYKKKMMIKRFVKRAPIMKDYFLGKCIHKKMCRDHNIDGNAFQFYLNHHDQLLNVLPCRKKSLQICKLLTKLDIDPIENDSFFYTIDCFKTINPKLHIFDNYMIDYNRIVNHSFEELRFQLSRSEDEFSQSELCVIGGLQAYCERAERSFGHGVNHKRQLAAIRSLFERPSKTLFEGLQRILFYNQFLWQTGHTLNGLGRLDVILDKLYCRDISAGRLTKDGVKELLKDFFCALHSYYWFKSGTLMGDTGQIIILGGKMSNGTYFRNELTDLFIETAKELKLPDPKVLLRCTSDMPEDLLENAVDCISTGIGAPVLSNDDVIIPALISDGYEENDAYRYGTAACWEPLIPGNACDQNNIASLNFARPLEMMMEDSEFERAATLQEILEIYKTKLKEYIYKVLDPLTRLRFEEDPLLSLGSISAIEKRRDITSGGGKYNNLGLTSVGLGTAVNSLLNIQKFVFEEKRFTLGELNDLSRGNFVGQEALLHEMKENKPCYGCDDQRVMTLVNEITDFTSREFKKYHTYLGGHFKFGLSSPFYITDAKNMRAAFDGRRAGESFSVHISANTAIPTTELLSFAGKLEYSENRLNGNVVDFITSPGILKQNIKKYSALLRAAFQSGVFQVQMNVVDSKTLIAAKEHPEKFPQLVVRVWGFSAYFNDLPEEYKDVLIARAIESEKAA